MHKEAIPDAKFSLHVSLLALVVDLDLFSLAEAD